MPSRTVIIIGLVCTAFGSVHEVKESLSSSSSSLNVAVADESVREATIPVPESKEPSKSGYQQALPFPHPERRCSHTEVETWKSNMQFSLDLNAIAIASFGLPGPVGAGMTAKYPVLSAHCMTCFTDNVYCGATKCLLSCIGRTLSDECLQCCSEKCNPALQICLDVTDEDMPPVPRESQATPAPAVVAPTRAVRTRRAAPVPPVDIVTPLPIETRVTDVSTPHFQDMTSEFTTGPGLLTDGIDLRWPIAFLVFVVLASFIAA